MKLGDEENVRLGDISGMIQHVLHDGLDIAPDVLFLVGVKLIHENRFSKGDGHVCGLYERNVLSDNIRCVFDRDRDNGAFASAGNLEGTGLELAELSVPGPCAFRENEDRYAVFDLLNGSQDGFHSLLGILPVQEETMDPLQPEIQAGHFFQLLFRKETGQPGEQWVDQDHIEDAGMVCDVENRLVFWQIFLPPDLELNAADGLDYS